MRDDLRRICYASRASVPLGPVVLIGLQKIWADRNRAAGIAAFLFCEGDRVFQVLEGPARAIRETMDRIARDTRQSDIVMLSDTEIRARLFADWAFGATNPGDPEYRRAANALGVADFWSLAADEAAWLLSRVASRKRHRLCADQQRFRGMRCPDGPAVAFAGSCERAREANPA